MASNKKGGDIVLGVRHIAGIFLVMVVLFGVVFTLGYVLGRGQYDAQLSASGDAAATPDLPAARAADAAKADEREPAPAAEWEFYRSAEPRRSPERLAPQPKPVLAPNPSVPRPQTASQRNTTKKAITAPFLPPGATVLQVAALTSEPDALAMAQALQQREFPAFVLNPTNDHYYRVQVGPYPDTLSANTARRKLESQGFKTILRR
jgi:cell division septation protein DedD